MQHGFHLRVVREMIKGAGTRSSTEFAGIELPILALDGVAVTIADDLLIY
jgi:hypothetical protein